MAHDVDDTPNNNRYKRNGGGNLANNKEGGGAQEKDSLGWNEEWNWIYDAIINQFLQSVVQLNKPRNKPADQYNDDEEKENSGASEPPKPVEIDERQLRSVNSPQDEYKLLR